MMLSAEMPSLASPLTITLIWIVLPLAMGFSIYLVPKLDKALAIATALASFLYGLWQIIQLDPLSIQLIDSHGVSLLVDSLSGYFIVTNAVVTAAVVLYCWGQKRANFFYTQAVILHGSVNSIFICADLVSLYVALEVVGIAAFLLITYTRTDKSIWVGLRYLFVSNTAMLFYMMGALLVYQYSGSFAFSALAQAPTDAIALIFIGLLSKGGIFVSGLWLPLTHSESESPVSAMLSGVVVKAGVFPLVRIALMVEDLAPILQIFSVGTAILGTSLATTEKDTKRLLAWSTISQVGFVLAAPAVAGFYAFAHGLAKATLFLTVGKLPSRDFATLRRTPIRLSQWLVITLASLSLAGFPLIAGFNAKTLTLKQIDGWQAIAINIATVGSAIAVSKLIFLPFYNDLTNNPQTALPKTSLSPKPTKQASSKTATWSIGLLLTGLVVGSALQPESYTLANLAKALGKVGLGFLIYQIGTRNLTIDISRTPERLENLIGGMSIVLALLFWIVVA
ncbi:MAG: cation:proton antiporter [Cyanobacteria bacterium P01_C01_bin.69]